MPWIAASNREPTASRRETCLAPTKLTARGGWPTTSGQTTWWISTWLVINRRPGHTLACPVATDVVAHAHVDEIGTLDLDGRHHRNRITITGADRGRWRLVPVAGLLHAVFR
jgi:hypothetical protein